MTTTNPQGHPTTYAYNAGGLLTSTTDADGRTITYGYNAIGQETSETWVNGSYTATYQYDHAGELTQASDPNSVYSYTCDADGRETSVSNSGTPSLPTVTLSYTYDALDDRTSLTDSLGGNISYGYNGDQQLTSLTLSINSGPGISVTLGYDAANRLTAQTRKTSQLGSDTITTSYTYDNANELTNITSTDTTKSVTLANYTYSYTKGELTGYQDNSGNSLTYGYDANGELTSATGTLNSSNYTLSYNYDLNGNRTSTSTDLNGTLTSSTYSTGTGNEMTSDGTYSYTYDNVGNMTSQTNISTGYVTYYSWDYRNRLIEVKQEDNHSNVLNDEKFTYDVNNNRIAASLNGTVQLYTVYDGANPYMDFNGSGTLTQRYLTNPKALSQFYGQVSASGTVEWFLTDNINSIRQVVSTSGSVLDAITYDPYGIILSQTNSANAPRVLYAGGVFDSITGSYQFGERPYLPADGRLLSQDWEAFATGNPNLYAYVFNNPLDITDPSGFLALFQNPVDPNRTPPPGDPNNPVPPPMPFPPPGIQPGRMLPPLPPNRGGLPIPPPIPPGGPRILPGRPLPPPGILPPLIPPGNRIIGPGGMPLPPIVPKPLPIIIPGLPPIVLPPGWQKLLPPLPKQIIPPLPPFLPRGWPPKPPGPPRPPIIA